MKLNYIENSFHKSIIDYQQQYKSKHWIYYNNKKIKLLNKKFIKDFRKNDPSISKELKSIENFTKKNRKFVLAGKKDRYKGSIIDRSSN